MQTDQFPSKPNGMIPNNRFPLLVHRNALPGGGVDAMIARFRENGWSNNWSNPGVYTYPHFHSTTHECLGCAQGHMSFRLSVGDCGWTEVHVDAGDIIVMPAGVSHQDIDHSPDNLMCGGYDAGRDWDNIQDAFLTPERYYVACKSIMSLPIPAKDPATGKPMSHWLDAPSSVEGWMDWRDGLDHTS